MLEMTCDSSLTAHLIPGGQAVLFRDARGNTILRYDQLHVFDANGHVLSSRFELGAENHILIIINDQNAVYTPLPSIR